MIRTRKRGSYNLAYLIEHKTQYFQPVSTHRMIEKRVEKSLVVSDGYRMEHCDEN